MKLDGAVALAILPCTAEGLRSLSVPLDFLIEVSAPLEGQRIVAERVGRHIRSVYQVRINVRTREQSTDAKRKNGQDDYTGHCFPHSQRDLSIGAVQENTL